MLSIFGSDCPSWLAVLGPVGECHLEPVIPGSDILVWHANLEFVPWIPPLPSPKPPWSETYGKSLMARDDGSWTVAEIELVRRFRKAGWQAGWMDTWGKAPQKWSEWIVTPESLPLPLETLCRAVTNAVDPDGGGGPPDIIAWQDGSISDAVFVESKVKDKVLLDQEQWFREAENAGVSQNQLAIARWSKSNA
jgi:hypothetical protein